jgi:hypothetical protein
MAETGMDRSYVSVQEFKDAFPEIDVSRYTDATLSGFISRASRWVDRYCSVDGFDHQSITNEKSDTIIDAGGNLVVWPRKIPVELSSVSLVQLKFGNWDMTLTLTQSGKELYEIPEPRWRITLPNQTFTATGTFTVSNLMDLRSYHTFTLLSYSGGYRTIPEDIKDATLLAVRDIVSRRLNAAGATRISQGGISIEYAEREGESDSILDAKRLLDHYVRRMPV